MRSEWLRRMDKVYNPSACDALSYIEKIDKLSFPDSLSIFLLYGGSVIFQLAFVFPCDTGQRHRPKRGTSWRFPMYALRLFAQSFHRYRQV